MATKNKSILFIWNYVYIKKMPSILMVWRWRTTMAVFNGETCVICEKTKTKGIHLYTRFICHDCEKEMVLTETSDEKYQYYLKKLRKLTQPELYS